MKKKEVVSGTAAHDDDHDGVGHHHVPATWVACPQIGTSARLEGTSPHPIGTQWWPNVHVGRVLS